MFNKIKQKIISRKQSHYYQYQYLYIGSTQREQITNDIAYTYLHYDIFLANSPNIPTKLTRLTGDKPNGKSKYNKDVATCIHTIIDANTQDTYIIHCRLSQWLYDHKSIISPPELSIEKLKSIVDDENYKNQNSAYFDAWKLHKRSRSQKSVNSTSHHDNNPTTHTEQTQSTSTNPNTRQK